MWRPCIVEKSLKLTFNFFFNFLKVRPEEFLITLASADHATLSAEFSNSRYATHMSEYSLRANSLTHYCSRTSNLCHILAMCGFGDDAFRRFLASLLTSDCQWKAFHNEFFNHNNSFSVLLPQRWAIQLDLQSTLPTSLRRQSLAEVRAVRKTVNFRHISMFHRAQITSMHKHCSTRKFNECTPSFLASQTPPSHRELWRLVRSHV